MPLRFSLREHKSYATFAVDFTFSKSAASVLRMLSGPGYSLGDGYFFIVADRTWLNGKYLRFNWRSDIPDTLTCYAYIYDGEYDRSSDVDFPSGSGILIKGNGLLQTVASRSAPFAWQTVDVQMNLGTGSEDYCTIFFKLHDNQGGDDAFLDLDWFEINSGAGGIGSIYDEQFTDAVTMEKTGSYGDYGYISTGSIFPTVSLDLAACFEVGQGSVTFPAKFDSGQNSVELGAGFTVRQAGSQDLTATFVARRDGIVNLPAALEITQPMDLKASFRVEKTYDLRGTAGIAFYWWGAANPPEAMNQLILETPTGFWYSDFYDGSARLRYVFIPWSKFTWVSAKQRHLEPHRHGFNEPDKSQIDGILYTIHTTGVRRIDYIHAPFMRSLLGKFIVQQPGSTDFLAGFAIARPGSQDLLAGFAIRRPAAENLSSGFSVKQDIEELPSTFKLTTLEISLREHKNAAAWDPNWTFSKPSASIVRAETTAAGSALGTAYMFFTVSKEYINGKYIRITWQGDYTWGSWGSRVYVFDGSYDRQSELDFPSGSGLLLKGNGLLQTGLSHLGDFGPVTEEFQVDVSGSALENVTIMVVSGDSWTSQWGWLEVDLIEINSAAAGAGTLWREPFNGDITMERLGSTGDYGYISTGQTPLGAAQDLMAGFNVGQDARDLAASFDGQVPVNLSAELTVRQPSSADLLGEFVIRQWYADLAAKFIVRQPASEDLLGAINVVHFTDLPAELTVKHPASADFLGGFFIRQDAEDLASKFTIRQDVMNLPAKMGVIGTETEDFEDETLVDHYQHYSGPGFRNAIFPHTGSWSWRTPQNQIDVFDISNGRSLSYAKITVWAKYGNGTRKIELLDSDFNMLAKATWTVTGYIQKSVEFTGAVKYFRITCPFGGNSGLWTDDIVIKWA